MENHEKAYYEKVDIDNELKLRKQLEIGRAHV